MLEVAAWIIPVIRKIQTRWGQQDLGEEKLITVTTPPGTYTRGHRQEGFLAPAN